MSVSANLFMWPRRRPTAFVAILCLGAVAMPLAACSPPPARTPGGVPLRTSEPLAANDAAAASTEAEDQDADPGGIPPNNPGRAATPADPRESSGSTADAESLRDDSEAGLSGSRQADDKSRASADGHEPTNSPRDRDEGRDGPDGSSRAPSPNRRTTAIAAREAVDASDPALARAILETQAFGAPLASMPSEQETTSPSKIGEATDQADRADPADRVSEAPAPARPRPPDPEALETFLREQSPPNLYVYGLALEAQGFHRSAAMAFEAYGEARPEMVDIAQMAAGNAFFANGAATSAARAFERSLARAANEQTRFLAALRLGNARLRAYSPDSAIEAYRQALSVALDDNQKAQALAGIIAAELESGRPAAARDARLRIVREFPDAGLAPAALARLEESGVSVDELDKARVLAGAGDRWGALTLLDEAMRQMTSPPTEWRLELATQYSALGEHAQAVTAAKSAMTLPDSDPHAPDLAWQGARALQRLGRYTDASAQFRSFVERWPGHAQAAQALWQLAWIQTEMGDSAEAEAAYLALARRYPDFRDAEEAGFRAGYVAWRDGRIDDAVLHWTEVADTKTGTPRARALYWLGRLAFDAGDRSAAETRWIQASAADPLGYYGHRSRERAGLESDSTSEDRASGIANRNELSDAAIEAWLSTWRSSPSNLQASRREIDENPDTLRAQAWLELGERAAASRALRRAISAYSRDPAGLVALAERALFIDLPEVSVASAASVLIAAPPDRREAAPLALSHLAYPAPHLSSLLAETAPRDIPPPLMLGLVRQESRFASSALSHTGAMGLTQVMPATGRQIAGWLGDTGFALPNLNDPATSLRYGAAYLAAQLDRFDGRWWPALAAYNGGPGNADRWFAETGDDQDRFVEEIDFRETRRYVQLVLAQVAQYARLYPELDE